jgi:hypothetical protein
MHMHVKRCLGRRRLPLQRLPGRGAFAGGSKPDRNNLLFDADAGVGYGRREGSELR